MKDIFNGKIKRDFIGYVFASIVFAAVCFILAVLLPIVTVLCIRSYPKHKTLTLLFIKEFVLNDVIDAPVALSSRPVKKLRVDKARTAAFYGKYLPCDCKSCQNYVAQIKTRCPQLMEFFAENGVDVEKPFELIADETDGKIDYSCCMYLVFGVCPDDFKLTLDDVELSLNKGCHPDTSGYLCPNFVLDFAITLNNLD